MKRFRFRTDWMTTLAGFQMFSLAAASGLDAASSRDAIGALFAVTAVAAGCLAFASHRYRRMESVRLVAAAAVAAVLAYSFFMPELRSGHDRAVVSAAVLAAVLVYAAHRTKGDPAEVPAAEINLAALAVAAAYMLVPIAAWIGALAIPSSAASGPAGGQSISVPLTLSFLSGLLIAFCEWRSVFGRFRVCVAILAGSAAALAASADGTTIGAMSICALFGVLILSWYASDNQTRAVDASGLDGSRLAIIRHQQLGEMNVWGVVAVSAVYGRYGGIDTAEYFPSILVIAALTTVSYQLIPAAKATLRTYLLPLSSVVVSLSLLMHATGGIESPFTYLTFVTIFAGSLVLSPIWTLYPVAAYYAFFLFEVFVPSGLRARLGWTNEHATLTVAMAITGTYVFISSRNRARESAQLKKTNENLSESLKATAIAKARAEDDAVTQRRLNRDLVDMRTALMNLLEDVEESKRQIESERRRESASFDALAEGVVASGKDGKIFRCNPTAARIIGMEARDVIGQPIERVLRLFREDDVVMRTDAFVGARPGRGRPGAPPPARWESACGSPARTAASCRSPAPSRRISTRIAARPASSPRSAT